MFPAFFLYILEKYFLNNKQVYRLAETLPNDIMSLLKCVFVS